MLIWHGLLSFKSFQLVYNVKPFQSHPVWKCAAIQINLPATLSVCSSASLELVFNLFLFHFRCWLSSDFPQMWPVYYTTTLMLPCSVVLSNCCLLVLVVFKLRRLRREGGSSWRNMCKDRGSQLVKDCTTVLGLSCVLGLTWAFTSTTYVSIPGMYIFTVLNSLQGQSVLAKSPGWTSHLFVICSDS